MLNNRHGSSGQAHKLICLSQPTPFSTHLEKILDVFDLVVDEPHIEAGFRERGLLFVLANALILALRILIFLLHFRSQGIFAGPALLHVETGAGLAEYPVSVRKRQAQMNL